MGKLGGMGPHEEPSQGKVEGKKGSAVLLPPRSPLLLTKTTPERGRERGALPVPCTQRGRLSGSTAALH